jgi:hypothetical protein
VITSRPNRDGSILLNHLGGADAPFIFSESAGAGAAVPELLSIPLPAPCDPGAILFDAAGTDSPVVPLVAESTFIAGSADLAESPVFTASLCGFCAQAPRGSRQTIPSTPHFSRVFMAETSLVSEGIPTSQLGSGSCWCKALIPFFWVNVARDTL